MNNDNGALKISSDGECGNVPKHTSTPRTELIAEIADDISTGTPSGKYDCAFFLDTLIDQRRVTADDVAILLTLNEHTDAHINVSDRLRELVEADAVRFFTDDPRGQEHVDELLAVRQREAEADDEWERKYGCPDGDAFEERLIERQS